MLNLKEVTLIGIDCVNLERLVDACNVSCTSINFGAVKMLSSLPSKDPRIIKIDPITSTEEYSDFCIKKLHAFVDTKYMIVFQYDGFILNPSSWTDDFLKYDYIGAPWYHLGPLRVGNGGFSLRSTKMMKFLSENWQKIDAKIHPEDVFISRFARPILEDNGFSFANEETASLFSKEGNEHSVVWNGEFGFHGIKYTNISKWLEKNKSVSHKFIYELDDYANTHGEIPSL